MARLTADSVASTAPLRLLAWAALLCLAAACSPARMEVQGDIVRNARFEGNGGIGSGQNDYQLRQGMQQGTSKFGVTTWPFLYFTDPVLLQPKLLPSDAYRLEVWYAHHGWFDAQVFGWQVVQVRPSVGKRAGVVDLVATVDPGPPSLVRGLDVVGLGPGLRPIANAELRSWDVKPGAQYDLVWLQYARDGIRTALQNQAHAYAQVDLDATAYPEEHAVDVAFRVDEGIPTRFGDVRVTGNADVPTKYILAKLPFEKGDPFRADDLSDGQRDLFGLSTFSIVRVEPDLSDPTAAEVPIDVSVTEAKFRTFRVGGGFDFDNVNLSPRITASYRDVNVAHQLIRLDLGASLGFSYVYNAGASTFVITWGANGALGDPRLFGPDLGLELSASYVQDVQRGGLFAYRNPVADLQITWQPSHEVAVRLGPHFEEYQYLIETPKSQQAAQRLFGKGFVNPYFLTALDQQLTIDWRDDPIFTKRGEYYLLALREAIPLQTAGFSYFDLTAEGRGYRPLRFGTHMAELPVVVAGKLRGRWLIPWTETPLPYPELAFLGGSNGLRGFRTNQVGPYDTLCTYTVDDAGVETVEPYYLPEGGALALDGSGEFRYDWAYGVSFALFGDLGVLEPKPQDLSFDDLRWSTGVGARYKSLIGPIRLDLGFRPLYPEDAGPAELIGCKDPGDAPDRYYDMFSLFGADVPFAMNVFVGIGEAF